MPKGCVSSRCASGARRDTTERKGLLCFCSLSQNIRDGPEFCPGSLLVWSSPQSGTARLGFQAELLGIITKQSLKFGCELLQKGVGFFSFCTTGLCAEFTFIQSLQGRSCRGGRTDSSKKHAGKNDAMLFPAGHL